MKKASAISSPDSDPLLIASASRFLIDLGWGYEPNSKSYFFKAFNFFSHTFEIDMYKFGWKVNPFKFGVWSVLEGVSNARISGREFTKFCVNNHCAQKLCNCRC